jgi:hypothetical protein
MQKSPTTDKTLGLSINREVSFADVRQRATEDYQQRKKRRDKKDKKDKRIDNIPMYKPGDLVVISTQERKNKQYVLVEVFDFEQRNENRYFGMFEFTYFGIVKKTTSKELNERVGRAITFQESPGYFSRFKNEKFDSTKIKWLE